MHSKNECTDESKETEEVLSNFGVRFTRYEGSCAAHGRQCGHGLRIGWRRRVTEESTFSKTCLPAPVPREAASSDSSNRQPVAIFAGFNGDECLEHFVPLQGMRAVEERTCPGTCLPTLALGEAMSREEQQLAEAIFMGAAAAACLDHFVSFSTFVLRFLNVGRVE